MGALEVLGLIVLGNLISTGLAFYWFVHYVIRETDRQMQFQMVTLREAEERQQKMIHQIMSAQKVQSSEVGFYSTVDKKRKVDS